jgi:arabinogalactan oligomer/maltooligosaccharide transport system permease protein
MAAWSGRRRYLTVLAFIGPTLIGVLIFNIYPIIFNTYISFTNRNQFHPNPDCSIGLTGALEPTCWGIFKKSAPIGLATPFHLKDPLWGNYTDLMGDFFTPPVLAAFFELLICLVPFVIAAQLNKRFAKQIDPPASQGVVIAAAVVLAIMLAFILKVPAGLDLMMKSGDFFVVTFRTVLYVIACIPLFFITGLGLALLLNTENLPGRTFFRVALIVPWAASTVAIMMSLVWKFFFQEKGTINQLLAVFGIQGPVWLNNPTIAFLVIVIANVWYTYPFFMVTILGALQSIPSEIYEAAEVDGATYWQKLMNITLPLLRVAVVPIIVLSSISTFQMFGTVWAITAGGPSRGAGTPGATELVMVYAYKQVFQTNAFGLMGAFAVIMFIMLFGTTLYSLRISRITKGAYEA